MLQTKYLIFWKIIFDQSSQSGKLPDDWVEATESTVLPVPTRHRRHTRL